MPDPLMIKEREQDIQQTSAAESAHNKIVAKALARRKKRAKPSAKQVISPSKVAAACGTALLHKRAAGTFNQDSTGQSDYARYLSRAWNPWHKNLYPGNMPKEDVYDKMLRGGSQLAGGVGLAAGAGALGGAAALPGAAKVLSAGGKALLHGGKAAGKVLGYGGKALTSKPARMATGVVGGAAAWQEADRQYEKVRDPAAVAYRDAVNKRYQETGQLEGEYGYEPQYQEPQTGDAGPQGQAGPQTSPVGGDPSMDKWDETFSDRQGMDPEQYAQPEQGQPSQAPQPEGQPAAEASYLDKFKNLGSDAWGKVSDFMKNNQYAKYAPHAAGAGLSAYLLYKLLNQGKEEEREKYSYDKLAEFGDNMPSLVKSIQHNASYGKDALPSTTSSSVPCRTDTSNGWKNTSYSREKVAGYLPESGLARSVGLGLGGAVLGGYGPMALGMKPHAAYSTAGVLGGMGLDGLLRYLELKRDTAQQRETLRDSPQRSEQDERNLAVLDDLQRKNTSYSRAKKAGDLAGAYAGVGGLAGGLLGAGYGAISPGEDEEGKKRNRMLEALKRGLLGGLGGAGLGALGSVGLDGLRGYDFGNSRGNPETLAKQHGLNDPTGWQAQQLQYDDMIKPFEQQASNSAK